MRWGARSADPIRWAETAHGRIAWRADGPAGGVPLVLLGRLRGTMDDWDPRFIARLAADRRVIRFDSAGIGRSTGRAPDSIAGMAAITTELLGHLALGPVDMLGWSLGGMVAQQLALDAPKLLRRLILAASSPGGIAAGPQPHPRVPGLLTRAGTEIEDFLFLFYPETEMATVIGRASLARIHDRGGRGPVVTADALLAQTGAMAGWPGVLHRACELRLPILVANGAHDVIIPAYHSYVLSQQAPDARLLLYPDAGHAFLFQEIDDFATQIDLFLA